MLCGGALNSLHHSFSTVIDLPHWWFSAIPKAFNCRCMWPSSGIIYQLYYMGGLICLNTYFYDILVCRYGWDSFSGFASEKRKQFNPWCGGLFKSLTVTTSDSKLYLTWQTSVMKNKTVSRYAFQCLWAVAICKPSKMHVV